MKIGDKIKTKRQERNLSRDTLAQDLDISIHTLAKYEQNQRVPKLDMLKKIAGILDISVESLLEEESLDDTIKKILENQPMDNTTKKINDMDKTIQNIPNTNLNRQGKEQLLMSDLDNILKTYEKIKANQNALMNSLSEQKKLLEDNSGVLPLIGLCKSIGLTIKGSENQFDENIQEYNIKYKSEDFNISEKDFQRLLKNVCDFTLKEALMSQFYDFLGY